MFKEVDGELGTLHLPDHGEVLLLGRGLEYGQGAGGLELGLEPVLRVGVAVGHVDAQAPVFAQNDQRGSGLGVLRGRERERENIN